MKGKEISPKMPPSNLKNREELTDWWRKTLSEEGQPTTRMPLNAGFERECSRCGAINPCSGTSKCFQCGHSLKGARRRPDQPRHTPEFY